jgi:chemotaxis protein MotB
MSEEKKSAPAWMVSFGDMMTLILTFFILLVSMSKTQQVGLVATGVGSFVVAIRSFGLPGTLDEYEKASFYENVRKRFSLPAESDPERQEDHLLATNLELIRAEAAQALRPHDQIGQPAIATFAPDSSTLTESTRRYLDLLSESLYPQPGEMLLFEGHALDAGPSHRGDNHWLAFERARAVRDYMHEQHDYPRHRLEARAWVDEIDRPGIATRVVDARLVVPVEDE